MDRRNDPNHKGITVYIRKTLILDIKRHCLESGVSMSEYIESLAMQHLHPKQRTFGSLLSGKDLESLALPAGIPVEKLEEIAQGARPEDEEIVGLACALNIDGDELLRIRKQTFGNGFKSEVKPRGR